MNHVLPIIVMLVPALLCLAALVELSITLHRAKRLRDRYYSNNTTRVSGTCEYFTRKYRKQFRTVKRYAVKGTCECAYLGAGFFAFWARLGNGYEVAASNNEMDGVQGYSDAFTVCVYLDGGFIANLVEGTLDEQLRCASDRAFGAPTDDEILDAVKREYLEGVLDDIFPSGIVAFSDLHDYTDANMIAYELTTRRADVTGEKWVDFFYPIQDRFTAWLQTPEAEVAIGEVIAKKRLADRAAAVADDIQALIVLYSEEIHALESAGWQDVRPIRAGGTCTALQASKGQRHILATDGEHALVRGRDDPDDEESTGWCVSLYGADTDGEALADTDAPTLIQAVNRALAAAQQQ